MKKFLICLLLLGVMFSASLPTVPHEFESRKIIPASWLNDNFNAGNNAITDGTAKINVNEIEINGSKLIGADKNLIVNDISGSNLDLTNANIDLLNNNEINTKKISVIGNLSLRNNLIYNGDASDGLNGWYYSDAIVTINNGAFLVSKNIYSNPFIKQNFSAIIGEIYEYSVSFNVPVSGQALVIVITTNTEINDVDRSLYTSPSPATGTFNATSEELTLWFYLNGNNYFLIDNVVIKPLGNSIEITGTANIENISVNNANISMLNLSNFNIDYIYAGEIDTPTLNVNTINVDYINIIDTFTTLNTIIFEDAGGLSTIPTYNSQYNSYYSISGSKVFYNITLLGTGAVTGNGGDTLYISAPVSCNEIIYNTIPNAPIGVGSISNGGTINIVTVYYSRTLDAFYFKKPDGSNVVCSDQNSTSRSIFAQGWYWRKIE